MALRCIFVSALVTAFLFCFVAVQAALVQSKKTLLKNVGKAVIIDCSDTTGCYHYLHWYQKKDGGVLNRILYMPISGGKPEAENGFEKFEAKLDGGTFRLIMGPADVTHSALYYCACWMYHGDANSTPGLQEPELNFCQV